MREYVCRFGHIHWSLPGERACKTRSAAGVLCVAPATWTGRTRGRLLDDPAILAAYVAQVAGAELAECWEWKGVKAYGGAQFRMGNTLKVGARAVAWEKWRGRLPKGRQVSMKCGERGGQVACVNPWHMKLAKKKRQHTSIH